MDWAFADGFKVAANSGNGQYNSGYIEFVFDENEQQLVYIDDGDFFAGDTPHNSCFSQ